MYLQRVVVIPCESTILLLRMGNLAEDLTKRWENFSLTKEESLEVEVQAEEWEDIANKGKFCLVGKLISDRIVGKETI